MSGGGEATERLRRLLAVLPVLSNETELPHAELERRTGVDAETLLDDLRALTDRVDEPRGWIESVGIVFESERVSVRTSHFRRPMRLTVPELCALELGLAMRGAAAAADERAPIDRARARVRAAIVATTRGAEEGLWAAVPPSIPRADIVAPIRDAARNHTKIRIAYRAGGAVEARERIIRPYVLVPTHGTWFVIAWCEESGEERIFRADRIESVEPLAETFESPDIASFDALAEGKPFHFGDAGTLVVRYSPRIARWIAERENVPVAEDGSVTVEHPLADAKWAVRHVLQYGPDAEVLAPESVRIEVARVLDAILAEK